MYVCMNRTEMGKCGISVLAQIRPSACSEFVGLISAVSLLLPFHFKPPNVPSVNDYVVMKDRKGAALPKVALTSSLLLLFFVEHRQHGHNNNNNNNVPLVDFLLVRLRNKNTVKAELKKRISCLGGGGGGGGGKRLRHYVA